MPTATASKSIFAALVKARKEFKPIVKNKKNPFHKSEYADLESVLSAVTDALCDNGLVIVQTVERQESHLFLQTSLYHESGEAIHGSYPLQEITDPQKMGSAITYARRYSVCAMLSVAPEDDDGQSAATVTPRPNYDKELVTEAQRKRMWSIAQSSGFKEPELRAYLLSEYQISSTADIKSSDYEQLCGNIQDKDVLAKWVSKGKANE